MVSSFTIVPGFSFKTRANFEHDSKFFGKFNRARLHHLGAEAGQFEHFIIGNLRQFLARWHNARIGRVNAVHVGIDLAQVGLERRRQRDRCQVRSAAAKGGDLAVMVWP